jgi:hypothetical protein
MAGPLAPANGFPAAALFPSVRDVPIFARPVNPGRVLLGAPPDPDEQRAVPAPVEALHRRGDAAPLAGPQLIDDLGEAAAGAFKWDGVHRILLGLGFHLNILSWARRHFSTSHSTARAIKK